MTRYIVNATMTVAAWTFVDADDEESAMNEASDVAAADFEFDLGTAEVDFNVTPSVEVWS